MLGSVPYVPTIHITSTTFWKKKRIKTTTGCCCCDYCFERTKASPLLIWYYKKAQHMSIEMGRRRRNIIVVDYCVHFFFFSICSILYIIFLPTLCFSPIVMIPTFSLHIVVSLCFPLHLLLHFSMTLLLLLVSCARYIHPFPFAPFGVLYRISVISRNTACQWCKSEPAQACWLPCLQRQ